MRDLMLWGSAYLLAGVLCLLVLVRTVPRDFDARENIAAGPMPLLYVVAWPIFAPIAWLLSRDWQESPLLAYRAKHRSPDAP